MLSFETLAVTVEEADAYALARGYSDWAGSNDVKSQALRRSQDYIAGQYNQKWCEEFENDDAPVEVKNAIIEGAVREIKTPGYLSPDYIASKAVKRFKAGPVEKEYAISGTIGENRPVVGIIDGLLAGLVCSGGMIGAVMVV